MLSYKVLFHQLDYLSLIAILNTWRTDFAFVSLASASEREVLGSILRSNKVILSFSIKHL